MKLNVLRADPAGNITLFVLDPVEKSRRADVAAQLMAVPEYKAEQVGFVCTPQEGGDGRMEMMGGEFCGNATRAFGLLTAAIVIFRRKMTATTSSPWTPIWPPGPPGRRCPCPSG